MKKTKKGYAGEDSPTPSSHFHQTDSPHGIVKLFHQGQTHRKEGVIMQLIEWEVNADGYEEQIIIPKEQRDLAAEEGIGTQNKQKVAVRILNLNSGGTYTGRLAITENHQTRPRPPSPGAGYSFNPGIRGNGGQVPLRDQASLQAYMTHV